MDGNKSLGEVNDQVGAINDDYERSMKLCQPMKDSEVLPDTPSTKKNYHDGKERFDQRVQ